ncbi:hypothetical protein HYDPIDRAFT_169341 [Hydnomerulius pinastri MD-312]|uniref:Unplaced genomic scaffold scaffold_24, whole genome shotgun sequence n=1 Tax=Hydnomerulius pinastri MD-312 TaxID=994086 RepID=A0A0C9WCV4_9AGAM|nr:hypothetical protein HYDPIDRAFT_169341 [Hydnomerulius pinastri MD-312]
MTYSTFATIQGKDFQAMILPLAHTTVLDYAFISSRAFLRSVMHTDWWYLFIDLYMDMWRMLAMLHPCPMINTMLNNAMAATKLRFAAADPNWQPWPHDFSRVGRLGIQASSPPTSSSQVATIVPRSRSTSGGATNLGIIVALKMTLEWLWNGYARAVGSQETPGIHQRTLKNMPALRSSSPRRSARLRALSNTPIPMAGRARQPAKTGSKASSSKASADPAPQPPSDAPRRGHASAKKRGGRAGGKATATPATAAATATTTKGPSVLKNKYREQRARFSKMGSGVTPDGPAPNLLADVLRVFPYYSDLDSIWRGIPSFDSPLLSSQPNVKHAESFLSLVQKRSTKDPLEEGDALDDQGELGAYEGTAGEDGAKTQDNAMDVIEDNDPAMTMDEEEEDEDVDVFYNNDDGAAMDGDEDVEAEPDVEEIQANQAKRTPRSGIAAAVPTALLLKHKAKTPSWDARSAFTRHTPYPRPPSTISSSSLRSGQTRSASTPSTRMTSSGARDAISRKIEELDKESDRHEEDADSRTRRAAMKYNYSIRKKELELQHDEHSAQMANAETAYRREHNLKMLDLQLKQAEETAFSRQIEMLRLQIELKNMEQASASQPSAGPSSVRGGSFGPSSSGLSHGA